VEQNLDDAEIARAITADAVIDKTADFKTKAMDALRCDGCSDSD